MPSGNTDGNLPLRKRPVVKFVLLLSVVLAASCVVGQVAGYTYSYFTSRLASSSDSTKVANWNVSFEAMNDSVAARAEEGFSTPWKISINNNSNVPVSYGHEKNKDDDEGEAVFSLLTLSGLPGSSAIAGIYIFDPDTGVRRQLGGQIYNNSLAIRFAGALNPGQSKIYYIQFYFTNGIAASENSKLDITAEYNFHFTQIFEYTNRETVYIDNGNGAKS